MFVFLVCSQRWWKSGRICFNGRSEVGLLRFTDHTHTHTHTIHVVALYLLFKKSTSILFFLYILDQFLLDLWLPKKNKTEEQNSLTCSPAQVFFFSPVFHVSLCWMGWECSCLHAYIVVLVNMAGTPKRKKLKKQNKILSMFDIFFICVFVQPSLLTPWNHKQYTNEGNCRSPCSEIFKQRDPKPISLKWPDTLQ